MDKTRKKAIYLSIRLFVEKCPPEVIGTLSVSDIARKYHLSRSYVSRCFRTYSYYLTLHEFIEESRIITFEILASGMKKPTVKQVLALMNIEDASYFIKVYKKLEDKTPGQYCKECRDRWKEIVRKCAERRKKQAKRRKKGPKMVIL